MKVGEERVGKKGFSRRGEEIKEGNGRWKRLKFIICMYKTAKRMKIKLIHISENLGGGTLYCLQR